MITKYQIKMTLKEIKPKIWRRLIITSNLLLSDLQKVIQTSIGWFPITIREIGVYAQNNVNFYS